MSGRRPGAAFPLIAAAAVCLLAVAGVRGQTPQAAFSIGVLPNMSARVILLQYQPMREYFAAELSRPVEIVTAPDFKTFSERTLRGDYHMVVTAANVGRVAHLDAKWEPIALYDPPVTAVLVAAADNATAAPQQLRGKSLAVANPQSLVVLRGLEWLREQGLQAGRDYQLVHAANDDSLGAVLRSGEAPLAIMSLGEFRARPESMRQTLRIAAEFAQVPGFMVMINPGLGATDRQRLKALMLRFPQTDLGKRFFAQAGVTDIREVTPAELQRLDAYVEPTRAGLGIRR